MLVDEHARPIFHDAEAIFMFSKIHHTPIKDWLSESCVLGLDIRQNQSQGIYKFSTTTNIPLI